MKSKHAAKWSLKKHEFLSCYVWKMVERSEDLELPRGEIPVYSREWYDRNEFERWLQDRFYLKFVREVLCHWPKSEKNPL